MPSAKYRVLIHGPETNLDSTEEIEHFAPMFFPTLTACCDTLGPLIARHLDRPVSMGLVNAKDFKYHRVIEFLINGHDPHIAVLRKVSEPFPIPN